MRPNVPKKFRVFLSSTFRDLRKHRAAVDESLRRLEQESSLMEYFGARPEEPKTVCFAEIERADVFVGVYAFRYGHIPPGDDASITEQEFDYARARGIPCLCYVADEQGTWPVSFIDKGEDHERLQRFKLKIASLVRATFSTPDNLARQVIADLSRHLSGSATTGKPLPDLMAQLERGRRIEIASTVGRKYIPELFVQRELTDSLRASYRKAQNMSDRVDAYIETCGTFLSELGASKTLLKRTFDKLFKMDESWERETAPQQHIGQVMQELRAFSQETSFTKYCYPALGVMDIEETLREWIDAVPGMELLENKGPVYDRGRGLKISSRDLLKELRPITAIVDRAGGGKTNAMCFLSGALGQDLPVMFLTAKAVPHATEDAIAAYLSSVYELHAEESLESVLATVADAGTFLLVIIDGINEHHDPRGFNAAFKAFVRRHYNEPIRYLITCRDIYWRFFSDDWWSQHCCDVIDGKLYTFTPVEFRRALPKYLDAYHINAQIRKGARKQLMHPLLLRFFCEAYGGTARQPSRLGTIQDVRLTPLFTVYCDRKYKQIQERLGLVSSHEIDAFVSMLGLMMLESKSRSIPLEQVRANALTEFGLTEMSGQRSTYVQILDEDIVIEQKPVGSAGVLNVEFVYDEFMEFIIARALFRRLPHPGELPSVDDAIALAGSLLKEEEKFVSVGGILVFIGELVAEQSLESGLKYLKWLTSQGRRDLACKLISRWPEQTVSEQLALELIELHRAESGHALKATIWNIMEDLHWRYWPAIFNHVSTMRTEGYFRLSRVFGFLSRTGGGVTSAEKWKSVEWVNKKLEVLAGDLAGGDYKIGVVALRTIIQKNQKHWKPAQRKLAKQWLERHAKS